MNARAFLAAHVRSELQEKFGISEGADLSPIVNAWMDDEQNAACRYKALLEHFPDAYKVLDFAAGCGDAVFYGLMNGFDAWGVEPSEWKQELLKKKAEENGYPPSWSERILVGFGEQLPFADSEFDAILCYQTLEHVADPQRVLHEMIRVTRSGGAIHLLCPDYRGSFEPHYRLPWLPLMPRSLARSWLRLNGRPSRGLDALFYITPGRVASWLEGSPKPVTLQNLDKRPRWRKAASAVKYMFRREIDLNMLITVS